MAVKPRPQPLPLGYYIDWRFLYHFCSFPGLFGYGAKSVRNKMKASAITEGPEMLKPPEEEKALKEQENYLTVQEWWNVFVKVMISAFSPSSLSLSLLIYTSLPLSPFLSPSLSLLSLSFSLSSLHPPDV